MLAHRTAYVAADILDFGTTARGLISCTATGLTYTDSTGVLSLTTGYVIPTTTEESAWNAAYGVVHDSKTPNTFLGGPQNGNAAEPSFRAIVLDDLPTMSVAKGGTNLTTIANGSVLATNAADTLVPISSVSGLKGLTNTDGVVAWGSTSGTGSILFSNSPTLVTPNIGAATANSITSNSGVDLVLAAVAGKNIALSGVKWPSADGEANQVPMTDGAGNLAWVEAAKTITTATNFYVSPTGSDSTGDGSSDTPWLTLNKAFSYLGGFRISSAIVVTIYCAAGTNTFSAIQYLNHVDGASIHVVGQGAANKTISAVSAVAATTVSVSGITRSGTTATATSNGHGLSNGFQVTISGAEQTEYNGAFTISGVAANTFNFTVAGSPDTPATGTILWSRTWHKSYDLTLDSVTGIEANDYVIVKTATGGTNPEYILGVWKVISVGVNSIRVLTKHAIGAASGSITGTLRAIKSVLAITGDADCLWVSNATLGDLEDMVIVGNGYGVTNTGLTLYSKASLSTSNVGVVGCAVGVGVKIGSAMVGYNLHASSNQVCGFRVISGCTFTGGNNSVSGNGEVIPNYAISVSLGSSLQSSSVTITGNAIIGLYIETNAVASLSSSTISGHTYGVLAQILAVASLNAVAIKTSGVGVVAQNMSFAICSTVTFTNCTVDSSPTVNSEGNQNSYIVSS